MKKTKLLFGLIAGFGFNLALAQDTDSEPHNVVISAPEIAILDIESTNTLDLSFSLDASGLESGEEFIIDEENNDLWINYTSLVATSSSQRSITIESSSVPSIAGLTLTVLASAHSGNGGGNIGTPTTVVTPSATPANIITGIGSAYTGDGNSNGHNLTYYLDFNGDFGDLNVSDAAANISMTYTITD